MLKFLRFLLFPFSLLYGVVTLIRNKLYDLGVKSSQSFNLPIISVGNLSVGGTGKTPHIEYLIELLRSEQKTIATLSRGYKRKTKGFVKAHGASTAEEIGDEPKQLQSKHNDIVVAVAEKRVFGIQQLVNEHPELDVILLDDAYQHRSVRPGYSILLTDYNRPFYDDYVLPTGMLREFRVGKNRANAIIVSKSPNNLSDAEKQVIKDKIGASQHQKVYFSSIVYGNIYSFFNDQLTLLLKETQTIFLFTGIANTSVLEEHVLSQTKSLQLFSFPDHHFFELNDIVHLKKSFENNKAEHKCILTTEKDAVRLASFSNELEGLPIYVISIKVVLHNEQSFLSDIRHFMEGYHKSK